MSPRDDFRLIAALFAIGMLVPVVVALSTYDVLSLYLTGREFTYVAAITFGLAAWVVLAVTDLNRVNFAVASLVLPWGVVVVLIFVGIVSFGSDNELGVYRYLFWNIEDLGAYAVAYVGAGLAALAVHRGAQRLAGEYSRVPASRTLALGFAVVVVVTAVAGVGFLHVTATSVSISNVESGVTGSSAPAVEVTLDGEPTELRVTVTAPDGATDTQRVSRSTLSGGTASIPFAFHLLQTDPQAGTYHVEVTAISGVVVDTATYTVDEPPTPSLVTVETAGTDEELHLDLPCDSPRHRPASDSIEDEPRVGVVVENKGDIVGRFSTRLLAGEDRVATGSIPVEPGRQGGQVFTISPEDAERIHEEEGGTLVVVVSSGDRQVTEMVELPEP